MKHTIDLTEPERAALFDWLTRQPWPEPLHRTIGKLGCALAPDTVQTPGPDIYYLIERTDLEQPHWFAALGFSSLWITKGFV